MIPSRSHAPQTSPHESDFNPAVYAPWRDRLPITRLGKQFFLPVAKIVWIGTKHRLVYAYTENRQHALDFGMEELFSRLDPATFFRVHRSAIVNLQQIEKVTPLPDGRCQLRMKDGFHSEVTVSRYRAPEFLKALRLHALNSPA
ncbi:MAG: LytTR family transcriptional regulator [candidate division KSB1 bacterium]|nr:LytTR family transcriptional regulator [candidate division KSB1 bacterium]MDZ7275708.1 LytTR family transcriptional regulator [candidate division KSB1 bacterium]MDZ7284601.1 LytTR family transcriptional regulator [candidate division KSB1 bacterium]MDZ7297980.1 LytTR family transcriptional regulator [candidate division KSB1 bacterium]MDZ7305852.1 LytTR family transcriptional regulator [candidate division KSB1 bacterium]